MDGSPPAPSADGCLGPLLTIVMLDTPKNYRATPRPVLEPKWIRKSAPDSPSLENDRCRGGSGRIAKTKILGSCIDESPKGFGSI